MNEKPQENLQMTGSNSAFEKPAEGNLTKDEDQVLASQPALIQPSKQPNYLVKSLCNCQWLNWLKEAIHDKASDLFLSVGEQPTLKTNGVFKRLSEIRMPCLEFDLLKDIEMP